MIEDIRVDQVLIGTLRVLFGESVSASSIGRMKIALVEDFMNNMQKGELQGR